MNSNRVVGLLLAGGQGRRLQHEKSRIRVGEVPMIDRVLSRLAPATDEIIVVGGRQAPEGIRLVPDDSPGAGPLAAIHTGISAIRAAQYLVVACDMPFITTGLLRYLLAVSGGCDAVVPVVSGLDQTLCAAYRRACLPAIARALDAGGKRVTDFFAQVCVCRLTEDELEQFGPPEILLFNVNTAEDLAQARQIARKETISDVSETT